MRTIQSGWTLWRPFEDLCGWRVPDARSPPPAQFLTVLGAEFDLRPFPHQQMIIRITERRLQVHRQLSGRIEVWPLVLWSNTSDMGKMQHASSMLWVKNGASKLSAFPGRQRESRTELNVQLRSAWEWWLRVLLVGATPREIPKHLF